MRARSRNFARKPALSIRTPTAFAAGFEDADVFVREGAILMDLWRQLKAASETRKKFTRRSLLEVGAVSQFKLEESRMMAVEAHSMSIHTSQTCAHRRRDRPLVSAVPRLPGSVFRQASLVSLKPNLVIVSFCRCASRSSVRTLDRSTQRRATRSGPANWGISDRSQRSAQLLHRSCPHHELSYDARAGPGGYTPAPRV